VGLGLGHLTSIRFLGPIGPSELLILLVIFLLLKNHYRNITVFNKSINGVIKFYLLISIFIIAPLMTLITNFLLNYNSNPVYIISFMMGLLLCFLLLEAYKKGFNMRLTTNIFALTFIVANLFFFFISPSFNENARFTGGANNPNQLIFYALSVSLLLVMFKNKLSWIMLPVITYFTYLSRSDAYILSLLMIIVVYIYLLIFGKIFYMEKLKMKIRILSLLSLAGIIGIYIVSVFINELIIAWEFADEAGGRTLLYVNAIKVILSSPLYGYGVGSFSGFTGPFGTYEAHNTFLDLSMQFGVIFSIIIYGLFIIFMANCIYNKQYLIFAFTLAFIMGSLFHFTARHFSFWVIFSIIYFNVFGVNYKRKQTFG
jgi:hypothetical protein